MSTETEYPPLVPLDVMPLHSGRHDKAMWGCEIAPRFAIVRVEDVAFDWRCLGCAQAAAGYVDAGNDIPVDWKKSADGPDEGPVMLSYMVSRSFYWLRGAGSR